MGLFQPHLQPFALAAPDPNPASKEPGFSRFENLNDIRPDASRMNATRFPQLPRPLS